MRFSLKTILITVFVIGAFSGVMAKLYTETPEHFFRAIDLLSTVLPFILAIGTIIWIGVRGRRLGSAAVCAHCKHDLRNADLHLLESCPICGADLGEPKAVLVERNQACSWRLVAWGLVLLLMPVIVHFGMLLLWPVHDPLQLLGNGRLIRSRLPNHENEPWVRTELANRVNRRALSQLEVEEATQQLISFMKNTCPDGWNQPMPWQKSFIEAAIHSRMISEATFLTLCDASYGPPPKLMPISAVKKDDKGFSLDIKYGSVWSDESGLGVEMLSDVKRVLLDDVPVKFRRIYMFVGGRWTGYCEAHLEPGDHNLTVEMECAYVDRSKLGPNTLNRPAPPWPSTRKYWTATLSGRVNVAP